MECGDIKTCTRKIYLLEWNYVVKLISGLAYHLTMLNQVKNYLTII